MSSAEDSSVKKEDVDKDVPSAKAKPKTAWASEEPAAPPSPTATTTTSSTTPSGVGAPDDATAGAKGPDKDGTRSAGPNDVPEGDEVPLDWIMKQVAEKLRKVEKDSGALVKNALKDVQKEVSALSERIKEIAAQIEADGNAGNAGAAADGERRDSDGRQPIPREALAEIESRWETHFGDDMSTMKEGLKHMVCAHNHNADLMIHLKEAMDDARTYLEEKDEMKASLSQWTAMMPYIEQFLHFSGERDREMQNIMPKLDTLVYQLDSVETMVNRRPWGGGGGGGGQNMKGNQKGQVKGGWSDQSYASGAGAVPGGLRRSITDSLSDKGQQQQQQQQQGGKGKGGKNMGKGQHQGGKGKMT